MVSRSPGLPIGDDDQPLFAEPWQAQAFAMAVHLHDRGLFTWTEWAEMLGRELDQPGVAADGSDYYSHWLKALERLIIARSGAAADEIDAVAQAWQRAARATPHGKPILLENDPRQN
jgi:nitrile hydratase accessory protein